MYIPTVFREDRLEVLQAFITAYPLATLVTCGSGGLEANLIPFVLTANDGLGVLRAHLSIANSQLVALREAGEVLVIFYGPEAYITPSWYVSRLEHGRVVPTWNYAVVQAKGKARVVEDADWLFTQLAQLTNRQEHERSHPWKISDAPRPLVEAQLKAIVGIEIPIDRLEGKWKVSQNGSEGDRRGVATGLSQTGDDIMADMVMKACPFSRSSTER